MKTRLITFLTMTVLATGLVSLSSGCAWSIGGKSDTCKVPAKPTRGQELIDLQKANEKGAISDAEYERLKQQIMEQ